MASGALGIITERDVPATMRDGVVLRADVFRPDEEGAFPGLLLRTPYGKLGRGGFDRFVRAGYAVVVQDSRGRYASDGDFVPFTVEDTGDAEDGYDTVEWLAARPWCNGRVGTTGSSYDAWMQWQLAKLRPPHLVAMCARTIPLELTAVDWPGGFRPGRRVRWWMASLGPDIRRRAGEPGPHTPEEAKQLWDETAQSSWLGFLPWLDLPRYLPKGLAEYAEDWLREPNRKAWKLADIHREVDVPNLDFSGWYDHCNDSIRHLALMQKNGRSENARTQTRLVAGPWNHPGLGRAAIGDIDFGPQAEIDIPDMIIRWFDYWLKGLSNGFDQEPAVRYFVMGSNRWKSAETWPPPNRTVLGIAPDVHQWAAQGYFALSIEYRLVTCTPAPACYQDTLCAIRWVHAHADEYQLDLDRVYITGMSAGGHLVSLAATLGGEHLPKTGGWEDQSCDFRAAISVSGAYDLLKLDWGCGWITPGVPWDDARRLGSPLEHVAADTKPMLVFHSENDGSIPHEQAVRMDEALTQNNVHHRFLSYPDRGHMKLTGDLQSPNSKWR